MVFSASSFIRAEIRFDAENSTVRGTAFAISEPSTKMAYYCALALVGLLRRDPECIVLGEVPVRIGCLRVLLDLREHLVQNDQFVLVHNPSPQIKMEAVS